MLIHNNVKKGDIIDDPLLHYFRSSVKRERHWTSAHVKLQLEYVNSFISAMYPDSYFIYLFDQSCGHTKVRDYSLVISNINLSYVGTASSVHDTLLQEVGIYPAMFSVAFFSL